ncbi:MAG: SCO family protein [Deltaproteobacteria bacterium]|nr:SCO family protein [Deltaproteobacteria bacterium]
MRLLLLVTLLLMIPFGAAGAELPAESLYNIEFDWRNQSGKEFKFSSLEGKPAILTLAYTQCKTACPLTMQRVKKIAESIEAKVPDAQFIIVSLDPSRDTPESMKQFQRQYALKGNNWHLLTGPESDLRKLTVLLGYSYQRQPGSEEEEIAHSNKIVALRRDGTIAHELDGLASKVEPFVEEIEGLNEK